MSKDFMTLKELCTYLRLSDKTIYRMLANNTIPGFKVGNMWRFDRKAIEIWLKRSNINENR